MTGKLGLQDVVMVIIMNRGNDYLKRCTAGSTLAGDLLEYFHMRAQPQWQKRSLLLEDRERMMMAFDVEFLLHFCIRPSPATMHTGTTASSRTEGRSRISSNGGAADSHSCESNDGGSAGVRVGAWTADKEDIFKACSTSAGDLAALAALPHALQPVQVLRGATDPRLRAIMEWARQHGVDDVKGKAMLLHAMYHYRVRHGRVSAPFVYLSCGICAWLACEHFGALECFANHLSMCHGTLSARGGDQTR